MDAVCFTGHDAPDLLRPVINELPNAAHRP